MPPFQFRLATLLRLRENARDQKRAHLAEAQLAEQSLEQHLAELEVQLAGLRLRSHDAARPGPINVDLLVDAQRFEAVVRADKNLTEEQKQLIAGEVQKRREALLAADRDVRVLENLKEKHQQEHRAEQGRRQVKALDEIAGRAWHMKRLG